MSRDHDLNSGQDIQARSFLSNVIKALEGGFLRRDVTHDQLLAARDNGEYFFDEVLSDRDLLSSGQEIQARNAFNVGMSFLSQILRRDVTPELLAARDGPELEDLVNSIIGSRDSNPEQNTQAGDGFAKVLDALASSRRDVASDELAARGDWEDTVKLLNTRELGFKRDIQARASLPPFCRGPCIHSCPFPSASAI